jgi:hypothetical protein
MKAPKEKCTKIKYESSLAVSLILKFNQYVHNKWILHIYLNHE